MTEKEKQYIKILVQICLERQLNHLASYILDYTGEETVVLLPKIVQKYNVTNYQEEECEGCSA